MIILNVLEWAGVIIVCLIVAFFGSAIIAGIWGRIKNSRQRRRIQKQYLEQSEFHKRPKKEKP